MKKPRPKKSKPHKRPLTKKRNQTPTRTHQRPTPADSSRSWATEDIQTGRPESNPLPPVTPDAPPHIAPDTPAQIAPAVAAQIHPDARAHIAPDAAAQLPVPTPDLPPAPPGPIAPDPTDIPLATPDLPPLPPGPIDAATGELWVTGTDVSHPSTRAHATAITADILEGVATRAAAAIDEIEALAAHVRAAAHTARASIDAHADQVARAAAAALTTIDTTCARAVDQTNIKMLDAFSQIDSAVQTFHASMIRANADIPPADARAAVPPDALRDLLAQGDYLTTDQLDSHLDIYFTAGAHSGEFRDAVEYLILTHERQRAAEPLF